MKRGGLHPLIPWLSFALTGDSMHEAVMEEPRTQLLSHSHGADAPLIEKTISQVLADNAWR